MGLVRWLRIGERDDADSPLMAVWDEGAVLFCVLSAAASAFAYSGVFDAHLLVCTSYGKKAYFSSAHSDCMRMSGGRLYQSACGAVCADDFLREESRCWGMKKKCTDMWYYLKICRKSRIKCGSFHIAFQKMNAYNGLKYDGNAERNIEVWKSISGRLSDI